jgi:hypothetical protein
MKRSLEVLGLVALFSGAACYSYRTIPIDDVRPELQVRLRVGPDAGTRIAEIVGYQTQDVEGKVVNVERGTMLLDVPGQTTVQGGAVERLYQRLDVPVSQVVEVEQRRLSRVKTFGFIAAAAVGAGGLAAWAFSALGSGSGEGTKGGTDHRLAGPLGDLRLAH